MDNKKRGLRLSYNPRGRSTGGVIYISDVSLWQKILAIPFMVLAVVVFFAPIYAFVTVSKSIGSVKGFFGALTFPVMLFLGFVVGIILVALVVQFIRFKIFSTYGSMVFDEKTKLLRFYRNSRLAKEVEINSDLYLLSNFQDDQYKISLVGRGESLDLGEFFTNTKRLFFKRTRESGRTEGVHSIAWHPSDEFLAAWLNIDLIRNNTRISITQSNFRF